MMELLPILTEYGLAAGAIAAMFYLAKSCADKTRAAIDANTAAIHDLRIFLKGRNP